MPEFEFLKKNHKQNFLKVQAGYVKTFDEI